MGRCADEEDLLTRLQARGHTCPDAASAGKSVCSQHLISRIFLLGHGLTLRLRSGQAFHPSTSLRASFSPFDFAQGKLFTLRLRWFDHTHHKSGQANHQSLSPSSCLFYQVPNGCAFGRYQYILQAV